MGGANTIYFAYGSNMCPEQMARRCPGGQALGQAELRD
ncbi:MAG: gamma-glutamylcyclotransferase, partial [Verrucomicrobia bacterium]|nr:gamma-glutamylcyclotransferase [Verrucomicrobiota bacterium]